MDYKDAKQVLGACEKATPGPWKKEYEGKSILAIFASDGNSICYLNQRQNVNADFIALSREALPYWVAEAERWKTEHASIECQMHEYNQFGKQYVEEKEAEIERLEAENESLRGDWQYFAESISPTLECQPTDAQDMGYVLTEVQSMREEGEYLNGIADELIESKDENEALREIVKIANELTEEPPEELEKCCLVSSSLWEKLVDALAVLEE